MFAKSKCPNLAKIKTGSLIPITSLKCQNLQNTAKLLENCIQIPSVSNHFVLDWQGVGGPEEESGPSFMFNCTNIFFSGEIFLGLCSTFLFDLNFKDSRCRLDISSLTNI